ncbi:DMT family transporter [Salmonella enterica subsp. enterica serovar Java]|uniref:DMT family transporter n=2 Tax=Salmonella enterica TaxID=28901 RepID=A0A3Z6QRT3_SALEB|nr:DMT family transporter [Salmonella enterica]EAB6033045.1 DMT family transporter [Salmonella enterica subsp. enterica serovar Java]EBV8392159.1 DMT family transporter [Salmonella enterica subsp. enterica serovar Virchow]ECA0404159.1 DMT family transporter [Salmonella enterica subsp. enterica serovar Newport]ECC9065762.1 DMT family transporter [Salmonella enterica subsp. diarizonae]ECM6138228.1 DMT family transporter [Salmonella enterica subsp. enterica serovar Enteritidis]EDB4569403.1 DMT f
MTNDTLPLMRRRLLMLDLGLLVVALSWGASYSLMQMIIHAGVTVPLFLMLRFALAVPFILIGARVRLSGITRGEIVNGLIFGILLYAILTFETLGVKYTSAANAGFLIALSVVLVPFFERILGKRKQSKIVYFTCFLSLAGGGLLSFSASGNTGFNRGDILILLAALIRGFQIFMFGKQTTGKPYSLINITLIELVTVAVLGLLFVSITDPHALKSIPSVSPVVWGYIIFLSLLATAFAFLMQLYAARTTSPTRVGLILSLEPAFAAIFAVVIMGETLGVLQGLGGGIIVCAALTGRIAEGKRYE